MNNKFKSLLLVAIIALSTFGAMGVVTADHESSNAGNVSVDADNPDPTNGTYGTVQDAVNNASDGYHVRIVPDTYVEDVNLTINNASFVSTTGASVTIDGELNGTWNENISSVHVGDNVTFQDGVILSQSAGGGISIGTGVDFLNDKLFGVPIALWGLLVLVVGYVGYVEFRN